LTPSHPSQPPTAADIQLAVVAVLRAYGKPLWERHARLAAGCCVEPFWLLPLLTDNEMDWWVLCCRGLGVRQTQWLFTHTDEWCKALWGLQQRGELIEHTVQLEWTLGEAAAGVDTTGWPDDRAAFVLQVLGRAGFDLTNEVML